MAKLKIRGLLRELDKLQNKFNTLLALAVYAAHRNGGSLEISAKELKAMPEAKFSVETDDEGNYSLRLIYEEKEKEPEE